jgi:hypothetical protein
MRKRLNITFICTLPLLFGIYSGVIDVSVLLECDAPDVSRRRRSLLLFLNISALEYETIISTRNVGSYLVRQRYIPEERIT